MILRALHPDCRRRKTASCTVNEGRFEIAVVWSRTRRYWKRMSSTRFLLNIQLSEICSAFSWLLLFVACSGKVSPDAADAVGADRAVVGLADCQRVRCAQLQDRCAG